MELRRAVPDDEIALQLGERFGAAPTVELHPSLSLVPELRAAEEESKTIPLYVLDFSAGAEILDAFGNVVRRARVPFKVYAGLLANQFEKYPESKWTQQVLTFDESGPARKVLGLAATRCWAIISSAEQWAFIASESRVEPPLAAGDGSEVSEVPGGEPPTITAPEHGRRERRRRDR